MSQLPQEPEAFAESIAALLKHFRPASAIELTGPSELSVDGRRLDLENLFRMVAQEPDRGTEIAEHYLEQLLTGDAMNLADMPFEIARSRIMPRIQPVSIFEHLSAELVAHVPYVNDTVIVFVTDMPSMTVSITTEQVVQWGMTPEDLEAIARENLDNYREQLHVRVVDSKEGGRAAILSEHDGYDAARLLMSELFERLAPQLGGDFYVATPARDMLIAMSDGPDDFVQRLMERVATDFHRMPYPITKSLFYVTRDGVAGTGGMAA